MRDASPFLYKENHSLGKWFSLYKKRLETEVSSLFMVEISGIEPLTS